MGSKIARQQELNDSKARARLLASQLDATFKRDRKVGSLVLGQVRQLRRRPGRALAVPGGLLALFLIRRLIGGSRR